MQSAVLTGARMEAIARAFGNSLKVAFERRYEWAPRQRDFIINGKPGISEYEYEAVVARFGTVGIRGPSRGTAKEGKI